MRAELKIKNQTAGAAYQQRFVVPMIVLLALLLRLLLWSQPLHQPANDEVEYITVARDLLAGRGWQFYEHYRWLRAPLYPLFLAASLWLANGDLHLAALPNLALSTANVYLCYRLALALVGRRAARVAALLNALLWTQATFASLYMSETLFTFLFTGALLRLARQPTTDDRRPTTDDRRPTTDDRRPTTDDRRPTADRRPPTADRRPTTDDRRPTTDDRRPTTIDQCLVALPPWHLITLSIATGRRSSLGYCSGWRH